jgi:DNA transposition AAA+ family ATPase
MFVAGLSQRRLARESGLSASRLGQWLSGKYSAQAPDIGRKLTHWLQGVEERRMERAAGLIPAVPDWKPTPTGENILAVFKYAQRMADMGIVYGGAGLGKTMTARRYQEETPNVWIATMTPSIMSVSACFERVAFAIGISSVSTSASRAENAVVARVQGSGGLIIVDEAQHLTVTCLDALRGLYDASGIGLVLMGNERVYAQLTGGSRKAHFAQLFSRIGRQLRLTAPVNGDIDTLLDAWGITEKQARALCREIGTKAGALRGLTKVLRQAGLMIDEADSASGRNTLKPPGWKSAELPETKEVRAMREMTCALCHRTLPEEQFRMRPNGRRKSLCLRCEGRIARRHGLKRRCHDCGAPTNNYRCWACWSRLRGKAVFSAQGVDPRYLP